jgi:hypothetical protein
LTSFGAGTSVESDGPASAGKWSKLDSSGVGQHVEYTTPVIPAGSYTLLYRYKTGGARARHTFELDGTPLGSQIDPYASTSFYLTSDRGQITFATSASHTIRLVTTGKNSSSSGYLIGSDAFTFIPLAAVAAPEFNVPDGAYDSPQTIALATLTPGASIRYTIDGSTPSATAGLLYTGPFEIRFDATVRAVGFSAGMADSAITVSTYEINGPAAEFDYWVYLNGLPGGMRGFDDDPAGDGTPNGLKFYLVLDPNIAAPQGITATTIDIGGVRYPAISFLRRQSLGGVEGNVLVSADLDFEVDLGSQELSAESQGDGTELVLVRSLVSLSAQPEQFFRVTATLPGD